MSTRQRLLENATVFSATDTSSQVVAELKAGDIITTDEGGELICWEGQWNCVLLSNGKKARIPRDTKVQTLTPKDPDFYSDHEIGEIVSWQSSAAVSIFMQWIATMFALWGRINLSEFIALLLALVAIFFTVKVVMCFNNLAAALRMSMQWRTLAFVLSILSITPVTALIPLVILNNKAKYSLRALGVNAGFMGASLEDIKKRKHIPKRGA